MTEDIPVARSLQPPGRGAGGAGLGPPGGHQVRVVH